MSQHDIQVHSFPTPNGQKITILLEELGVGYDFHPINIMKGDQLKPEFLKISPNNKIPAIVDLKPPGLDAPLSIFESAAILQYLAGTKYPHATLYPSDLRTRSTTDQWLYFQIASLGPMMGQLGYFTRSAPDNEVAINRFRTEVDRLFGVMEKRLAEVDYFNGAGFSIADIAIYPWVWGGVNFSKTIKLEDWPAVARWYEKIAARPAVQKGSVVGRPPAAP
ncbi:glutathione S-transferase [Zopfochytrium polystomum]|nr:glutathione S-transferase [Zopfochytrium polystomum]